MGTYVLIQSKNRKWSKQGVIVERLQNRQYRIKVKGSGRITLRNRRFIKPCSIIQPQQTNMNITHPVINPHQQIPISISPVTPAPHTQAKSSHTPAPMQPQHTVQNEGTDQHTHPPLVEADIPTGASSNNTSQKVPLALRKLMTFNKPGLKEQRPNGTRRWGVGRRWRTCT